MSDQFPNKRHKSFLENQDSEDLNISNEDEIPKEIETKLNLINETSSEEENFNNCNTKINLNSANKKLEGNKHDFEDFFKMLETSKNKNFSNYNDNDDESISQDDDCLNEFKNYYNNNHNYSKNFNNNFGSNFVSNNDNYDQNFNCLNTDCNTKKKHSHPVNSADNLNSKINKNPNSLECSENYFANNSNYNCNYTNNNNNNNYNYNHNLASNTEQFYNLSPNTKKLQHNPNLFYSGNGQNKNIIQNLNLNNINNNSNLNNNFYNNSINQNIHNGNINNNSINNISKNNNNINNNSITSNFSNKVPNCINNEVRKNSFFMPPYSQEEQINSIESFPCLMKQKAAASSGNNIQENLLDYNNLNATRRRSFNCLNNNANILGQDLFKLSPTKVYMKHQQPRKSFIYPGCKNSANYFNINLMPVAASEFNVNNNSIESREFYKELNIPFNNKNTINNNKSNSNNFQQHSMRDYYASNCNNNFCNNSNEQIFIDGSLNPGFYQMPDNNKVNFNMNNFIPSSHLSVNNHHNNVANYPQKGMNYYNIQAQAPVNAKIPNGNNVCSYNNNINNNNNHPNVLNNHQPNLNNYNTNCTLSNNNSKIIKNSTTNNKFLSTFKTQQQQTIKQNTNQININSYDIPKQTNTSFLSSRHNNNPTINHNNQNLLFTKNKKITKQSLQNSNIPFIPTTAASKTTLTILDNQAAADLPHQDPNNAFDDTYLIQNITLFLKDQNGCRLLQKKIEEKKYDFIMAFYDAVVKRPNFIEIVIDQFGNYVIQKFLEVVFKDKIMMTSFFENISQRIFDVSVNLYGTRVFQKALDLFEKNYQCIENDVINGVFEKLVYEHMMELIVDTNGNHVFIKVIGIYPKNKNEFIFNELFKKSKEIAQLKQGGTVFQKAFEQGNKTQKDKLVFEILSYIKELINDEYGNFIIQQIVFMKNIEYNKVIAKFICENVLLLSQQKFSSNVIDKCILLDDEENNNYIRENIINALIEKKIVGELLIDQFGNYVVQKSLLKSEEENFCLLIQEIKDNLGLILSKPFGRKIYDNLVKNYSEYLGNQSSKQILNSQEDKYKHINLSIKKSKKNENEKNQKI